MHKHHTEGACQARTDIDKLCKDPLVQQSYQEQLHNTLTKHQLIQDPNEALTDLLDYKKNWAAKTAGEFKRGNSTQHTADPTVTKLSEQQKTLRLKIYKQCKGKEHNNILRLISKRLNEVAVEEADTMVDHITSTDDCRKIVCAAKQLCSTTPSLSKTLMATSWERTKAKQELWTPRAHRGTRRRNTYHPAQAKISPWFTNQPPANSPTEQRKKNSVHYHSTPHQRQDRLLNLTLPKWFQKRQELHRHCMGTMYADLSGDGKEMGHPQDGYWCPTTSRLQWWWTKTSKSPVSRNEAKGPLE